MTSTTERYSAAASQATGAVEKIAVVWAQGAQTLSDHMLPGLPQIGLVPVVERYFEFVQRTVDISRHLTIRWAETADMLSGAARKQAESVVGAVREQAESARGFVHEQADKAEKAAREQAEHAEQAKQELAREARRAEREQARKAHDKARERYEGLTKAELSDLLSQRDLPKTGNVDELIERLVAADTK
jgi:hypothetical protein